MNVWRNRLRTLASPSETTIEPRGGELSSMASQRAVLGAGLAILLLISAASIGLEVKSRSDAASVDHTLVVLHKLSDMRLLLREAESAARGYVLSNDPNFATEFHAARDRVPAELTELIQASRDNPRQTQLLEEQPAADRAPACRQRRTVPAAGRGRQRGHRGAERPQRGPRGDADDQRQLRQADGRGRTAADDPHGGFAADPAGAARRSILPARC